MHIHLINNPGEHITRIISEGIRDNNRSLLGVSGEQLVVAIGDQKHELVGGLIAYSLSYMMLIDIIWIPENIRGKGLGRKIMERIESESKRRKCKYISLDTYAFQAPGFYEKLGYKEYGRVKDYLLGHDRIFFRKNL